MRGGHYIAYITSFSKIGSKLARSKFLRLSIHNGGFVYDDDAYVRGLGLAAVLFRIIWLG